MTAAVLLFIAEKDISGVDSSQTSPPRMNFAFCHNPKFQMDFELDKRGKKDFYKLTLNSNLICLPFT